MKDEIIKQRISKMTKRASLRRQILELIEELKGSEFPSDSIIIHRIEGYLGRSNLSKQTRFVLNRIIINPQPHDHTK